MNELPPLPELPPAELDASDELHDEVARRVVGLEPDVARLVRAILWRRLAESAAGVGAIEYECATPRLLVPPRRRFLSTALRGRLDGVEMALRHVDTRLAMASLGQLDHVVDRETPMVLNAFAESRDPSRRETNAGSVRVTTSEFLDAGSLYVPPDATRCRDLLDALTDRLRGESRAHPLELASWAALLMFAIHPFVDGNGRTARLMFHALHSEGVAGRFDWGSIEAWAAHRQRYLRSIYASVQLVAVGDPLTKVVPEPFARFALDRSIEGAARTVARIDHVDGLVSHWRPIFGGATITYAFIACERNVPPDELGDLSEHITIAEELRAAGYLVVDRLGRYDVAEALPLKSGEGGADGITA